MPMPSTRRQSYQCAENVFGSIGVVTIVVNTGISSASRSGWIERSISAVCG